MCYFYAMQRFQGFDQGSKNMYYYFSFTFPFCRPSRAQGTLATALTSRNTIIQHLHPECGIQYVLSANAVPVCCISLPKSGRHSPTEWHQEASIVSQCADAWEGLRASLYNNIHHSYLVQECLTIRRGSLIVWYRTVSPSCQHRRLQSDTYLNIFLSDYPWTMDVCDTRCFGMFGWC